ncbi:MAG: winged helix-turn-helix domain-containing protein [Nitrososphaera sp.]|uniref:winged helix-turn-helix domain-containing protein n=1 Tax=Nitrososphaera sp. TaxID=1971748 RepID=UPI003D6E2339
MGAVRRGWCDIVADILTSAKGGERVTEIMYQTKLSYPHMDYPLLLDGAGLLKREKSVYQTTESGLLCLKHYADFRSLVFADSAVRRRS